MPPSIQDQPIEPTLVERVRQKLAPDEQLLWIGQPLPIGQLASYITTAIFGLLLSAVGAFLAVAAQGFHIASLVAPGTIFFAVPGIAFIFWAWKGIHSRSKKILYAITTRRALTARFDRPGVPIGSVSPSEFARMRVTENTKRADGSGSIWFNQPLPFNLTTTPSGEIAADTIAPTPVKTPPVQPTQTDFIDIPNVRQVEALLRKLAQFESTTVQTDPT